MLENAKSLFLNLISNYPITSNNFAMRNILGNIFLIALEIAWKLTSRRRIPAISQDFLSRYLSLSSDHAFACC